MIKNIYSTLTLILFLIGCAPAEQNSTVHSPQNIKSQSDSEATFKIEEKHNKFASKKPYPEASDLIGEDKPKILSLFGNPHFKRHDLGVALLQYRIQKCVLDIVLYPIDNGNKLSVAHLEARDKEGRQLSTQSCITQLFSTREGRSNSKN